MNVAQLLDSFLLGPDIEIVEPCLPEAMTLRSFVFIQTWDAPRIAGFARCGNHGPVQSSYKAKLQRLDSCRKTIALRFADEQMHMFGHNDISQHDEAVTPSHTLQAFEEQIAASGTRKQWLPPIATECQEVQIPCSTEAFRMGWHAAKVGRSLSGSL